jgi:hypothetical protein
LSVWLSRVSPSSSLTTLWRYLPLYLGPIKLLNRLKLKGHFLHHTEYIWSIIHACKYEEFIWLRS